MNAIFTIVAKNYLPLAYTLKKSLEKYNRDIKFFVFVSDEKSEGDDIDTSIEHVYPSSLGISQELLNDLSFKYNVTEFCTSIKPHCFKYIEHQGYNKIIYFDPDIFVYQSLDFIFDELNHHFLVITPHYCRLEHDYSGVRNEGMILFSGVYNLGFCAVNVRGQGSNFISWWAERLNKLCYADKTDGLHTDQKWIDIVHCIFDEPIKVLKHPGTNAAIWNMHERTVEKRGEEWYISFDGHEPAPIVFYHFSSFNYYADDMPNKLFPQYKERFPFMVELCMEYRRILLANGLIKYKEYSYSYNFYENGDIVSPLHRRMYRRLNDLKLINASNAFKTGNGTFHEKLVNNKLLFDKSAKIDSQNENNMAGFDSKVNKINFGMSLIKSLLGVEKYFLLIKFFQRYSRFENQYFLISEFKDQYKFLNENRPDE